MIKVIVWIQRWQAIRIGWNSINQMVLPKVIQNRVLPVIWDAVLVEVIVGDELDDGGLVRVVGESCGDSAVVGDVIGGDLAGVELGYGRGGFCGVVLDAQLVQADVRAIRGDEHRLAAIAEHVMVAARN